MGIKYFMGRVCDWRPFSILYGASFVTDALSQYYILKDTLPLTSFRSGTKKDGPYKYDPLLSTDEARIVF